jgi:hypothetical protein
LHTSLAATLQFASATHSTHAPFALQYPVEHCVPDILGAVPHFSLTHVGFVHSSESHWSGAVHPTQFPSPSQ